MFKLTEMAIPFFALMIALETFFAVRHEERYDRKDVWSNIGLGFGSVAFGAIFGLLQAFVYNSIYDKIAPFQIPMTLWWAWLLLLFVDDFVYYWFHRVSHEIRIFWNFHVVHHSSNQYNLSVAVRQSWFSGILHWTFYVTPAFFGFPFWAFVTMHGANLLYQFWIHTKVVKKMPAWYEFIFNTPSHHRVHHGVNDEYQDKNYGGIFIFWDRMFGTFIDEKNEVRYGITTPLTSYNPLWINSHAWAETFEAMKTKRTIRGKMRCLFGAPAMDFEEKKLFISKIEKKSENLLCKDRLQFC